MTAYAPTARHSSAQKAAVRDEASATAPSSQAQVQAVRPTSTCVLIRVRGELDASGCAPLQELLATRLSSTVETLILELSQLSFIGVPGLELLSHTHRRAHSRGISLRLVTGPRCLHRGLIAAGLSTTLACYTSTEQALTGLSGYARDLEAVH